MNNRGNKDSPLGEGLCNGNKGKYGDIKFTKF
jgi:hypothetical protein